MASIEILAAFAVATLLFAYFPGPAVIYTAARTLSGGRRAGLLATLGLHIGGYVHVGAAVLGLAALLHHVPTAYLILKFAGAAYLIWMGVSMIRSGGLSAGGVPQRSERARRVAFVQSITVEVLNPKSALFYLAFLPQFVDPAGALPIWAQLAILGTIVNFAFATADVLTVFLVSKIVSTIRRARTGERIARWIGGSVLAGLGVHLAVSRH